MAYNMIYSLYNILKQLPNQAPTNDSTARNKFSRAVAQMPEDLAAEWKRISELPGRGAGKNELKAQWRDAYLSGGWTAPYFKRFTRTYAIQTRVKHCAKCNVQCVNIVLYARDMLQHAQDATCPTGLNAFVLTQRKGNGMPGRSWLTRWGQTLRRGFWMMG